MANASDTAYADIKRMILSGELTEGSQLTERDLAMRCGVSRTPARDAMRRLEAEGLVRRTETQRCYITSWNADRIEEIYSLRAMVESHAAFRAATRISPDQLEELRAANRHVLAAAEGSKVDLDDFMRANRDVHAIVLAAAQSERLIVMRGMLFEAASLPFTRRTYDAAAVERSYTDHEELILAFERRDADWARLTMEAHIRHAQFISLRAGQARVSPPNS